MMIKVLFYAYSLGITSSREIEDHLRRDTVFMFLAALQKPDYRTICLFRTRYLDCVASLFRQILQVCDEMGMIGMVNVRYDSHNDRYTCPEGKLLTHQNRQKVKDGTFVELYMAKESDCSVCSSKAKCTRAKKRIVSRNPREHLFEEMRERLKSPLGKALYKLRKTTVEPVNGNIKYSKHFDEFSLRGLPKTRIELVLMSIAHNLGKIHDVLNGIIPLTP
jgi:hypothetical protein